MGRPAIAGRVAPRSWPPGAAFRPQLDVDTPGGHNVPCYARLRLPCLRITLFWCRESERRKRKFKFSSKKLAKIHDGGRQIRGLRAGVEGLLCHPCMRSSMISITSAIRNGWWLLMCVALSLSLGLFHIGIYLSKISEYTSSLWVYNCTYICNGWVDIQCT